MRKVLDEVDLQILSLLRKNARMPLKDISSEVHLTAPALSARIGKLEQEGYIKGYHADVDLEKTGYNVKAYVQTSVLPEDHKDFLSFVKKKRCVIECSHITGEFSMMLKVVFRSTSDLDKFITELQAFGKTETEIVFSTLIERH